MSAVRFSVALATYNGACHLSEQLASIAAQSFLPAELIVQDDDSTDDTCAITEQFAARAPFPVRLEMNPERLGSTGNFERAVARCTGTHIALCDQDDVWLPEKLERIAGRFAERPELGLVFSNAARVDEDLRPLDVDLWQSLNLPGDLPRLAQSDKFPLYMLKRPVVTGATMAFDARLRDLVLPFPADLQHWIHDRWTATLIALVAPVEAIAEPLILYRQHGGQQIGAPILQRRPRTSRFEDNRARVADLLASIGAIRARLEERRAAIPPDALAYMDDLCAHLSARLALPRSRLARVPSVARELRSGRYARFSSGLGSALKDLAL